MVNGAWYNIDGTFKPIIKQFPEHLQNLSEEELNNLGWYKVVPLEEALPVGSFVISRTYEIEDNLAYEIVEYEENGL